MLRLFKLCSLLALSALFTSCTNLSGASKSSTSLTSFLGFSELPSWYITSQYTYPDSQYRDNDFGLPLHFRDVGEGDTIVLLHGELSSVHTWDRWVEILKQEFHVVAIDLPGSGITGTPRCISDYETLCPNNLSLDYIEHSLTYLIEDLQLRNFHLVGASLGGYIAARYALNNPDKLASLTLISPLGMQQTPPFMVNYLDNTSLISSYLQPSTIATTIVDDFYADSTKVTQETLQRYIHLLQAPGAHKTNVKQVEFVKEIMTRGTEYNLADIESRSLVMWGSADKWGDFEHAQRWVDEIPNSIMVEYRNVGHLSMEEHSEDSAYDLIAFINDEPLPSIEGLGRETFTMQDTFDALENADEIFAPNREILEGQEQQ